MPLQHDDLVAVGVAEDPQEYLLWIRLGAARLRLPGEGADLLLVVPDPELEQPVTQGGGPERSADVGPLLLQYLREGGVDSPLLGRGEVAQP